MQSALSGHQLLINAGILPHVLQKGIQWNLFCLYIFFECLVYIADGRRYLLLYTEVIPNKTADIISGAFLNFRPVFIVKLILLLRFKAHQYVIPDFVAFCKSKACRVQAFKDQLCIVVAIQRNTYDLKLADGLIQCVYWQFFFQKLITKKSVIDGHVRGRFIFFRITCDELFQCAAVCFNRAKLDAVITLCPLGYDKTLHDLIIKCILVRFYTPSLDHIANGKE